jgi:hypothetical protein
LREGSGTEDVPDGVVEADQRSAHAEMGCGEGGEVDGGDFVKDALVVEYADDIAGDQASKGVARYAQLGDVDALGLQTIELFLNLLGDTFAANLDAIVGEVASVALGHEDVDLVLGVGFEEGGLDIIQVVWVSPESDGREDRVSWRMIDSQWIDQTHPWIKTQRWPWSAAPPWDSDSAMTGILLSSGLSRARNTLFHGKGGKEDLDLAKMEEAARESERLCREEHGGGGGRGRRQQ